MSISVKGWMCENCCNFSINEPSKCPVCKEIESCDHCGGYLDICADCFEGKTEEEARKLTEWRPYNMSPEEYEEEYIINPDLYY